MNARCHVYTEKEGLLSRMAHDLRLRVERFDVKIEGEGVGASITATFDPSSLVVEAALSRGKDNPGALGAGDMRKIEDTIRKDVLSVRKHRDIRFTSKSVEASGKDFRVLGELELNGRKRPLTLRVRDAGDSWETETTLHQPDWGIKPYKAALGALKIKPDVRVVVAVPKA